MKASTPHQRPSIPPKPSALITNSTSTSSASTAMSKYSLASRVPTKATTSTSYTAIFPSPPETPTSESTSYATTVPLFPDVPTAHTTGAHFTFPTPPATPSRNSSISSMESDNDTNVDKKLSYNPVDNKQLSDCQMSYKPHDREPSRISTFSSRMSAFLSGQLTPVYTRKTSVYSDDDSDDMALITIQHDDSHEDMDETLFPPPPLTPASLLSLSSTSIPSIPPSSITSSIQSSMPHSIPEPTKSPPASTSTAVRPLPTIPPPSQNIIPSQQSCSTVDFSPPQTPTKNISSSPSPTKAFKSPPPQSKTTLQPPSSRNDEVEIPTESNEEILLEPIPTKKKKLPPTPTRKQNSFLQRSVSALPPLPPNSIRRQQTNNQQQAKQENKAINEPLSISTGSNHKSPPLLNNMGDWKAPPSPNIGGWQFKMPPPYSKEWLAALKNVEAVPLCDANIEKVPIIRSSKSEAAINNNKWKSLDRLEIRRKREHGVNSNRASSYYGVNMNEKKMKTWSHKAGIEQKRGCVSKFLSTSRLAGIPFAFLYGFIVYFFLAYLILPPTTTNVTPTAVKATANSTAAVKNASEYCKNKWLEERPTFNGKLRRVKTADTWTSPSKLNIRRAALTGVLTTVTLGLGSVYSRGTRCVMVLMLPSLLSRQGRIALMTLAIGFMIDGPLASIQENIKKVAESFTCLYKLLNQVSCRYNKMVDQAENGQSTTTTPVTPTDQPIINKDENGTTIALHEIKERIFNIVGSVEGFSEILDDVFFWLKRVLVVLSMVFLVRNSVRYYQCYFSDVRHDNMVVDRNVQRLWTQGSFEKLTPLRNWEKDKMLGYKVAIKCCASSGKGFGMFIKKAWPTALFILQATFFIALDYGVASFLEEFCAGGSHDVQFSGLKHLTMKTKELEFMWSVDAFRVRRIYGDTHFTISLKKINFPLSDLNEFVIQTKPCLPWPVHTDWQLRTWLLAILMCACVTHVFDMYLTRAKSMICNLFHSERADERAHDLYMRILSGRELRKKELNKIVQREIKKRQRTKDLSFFSSCLPGLWSRICCMTKWLNRLDKRCPGCSKKKRASRKKLHCWFNKQKVKEELDTTNNTNAKGASNNMETANKGILNGSMSKSVVTVEMSKSMINLDTRKSILNLDTRKSMVNLDARKSMVNLDTRKSIFVDRNEKKRRHSLAYCFDEHFDVDCNVDRMSGEKMSDDNMRDARKSDDRSSDDKMRLNDDEDCVERVRVDSVIELEIKEAKQKSSRPEETMIWMDDKEDDQVTEAMLAGLICADCKKDMQTVEESNKEKHILNIASEDNSAFTHDHDGHKQMIPTDVYRY